MLAKLPQLLICEIVEIRLWHGWEFCGQSKNNLNTKENDKRVAKRVQRFDKDPVGTQWWRMLQSPYL